MITLLLLTTPFVFALAGLAVPDSRPDLRRWLLPAGAVVHLALTAGLWPELLLNRGGATIPELRPWLRPDALGLVFLTLTSGLFLPASFYAVGDMKRYAEKQAAAGISDRVYVVGVFCFLLAMTAVCLAQDLGLMWVAVEATTLATAPLIYFRKSRGALEATWKYLLVCSIGIALALLGTFILAAAVGATGTVTLRIRAVADLATQLDPSLLKAAFIFLLVGYGAKMGLAPMHTWLPDAHSESPSPVSALLSGTLLNGAFLAILRVLDIMQSAGLDDFASGLLRLFGLLSMGVAGAFILGQKDYKRLLAYSSVEHMGILAFGAGLGGAGLFAALLHAVNHTFAKGSLFFTAGNIMFRYHSKSTLIVSGVRRALPVNGALWLAGFMAICGLPPFGLFLSEFALVACAFAKTRYLEAALFLVFLAVAFIGMLGVFLGMLRGEPPADESGISKAKDSEEPEHPEELEGAKTGEFFPMTLPALAAIAVALALGFGVPEFLADALNSAARIVDNNFVNMPGMDF